MTDNTPTRKELIKLREDGYTRERMAEHYDVSINTIRKWIKDLKVPRPSKDACSKREVYLSRNGEIIARPDDGRTTLEIAIEILEDRFEERRGLGYFLDGRPASVDKILAAAKEAQ